MSGHEHEQAACGCPCCLQNLSEEVEVEAFYDFFSKFGEILQCKTDTDSYGQVRRLPMLDVGPRWQAALCEEWHPVAPASAHSLEGNHWQDCFSRLLAASATRLPTEWCAARIPSPLLPLVGALLAQYFGQVQYMETSSVASAVECANGMRWHGAVIQVVPHHKAAQVER